MSDLTNYALNRVLFHLSEDQQSKLPGYFNYFRDRAAARVIVKRALRDAETRDITAWEAEKQA